MRSARASIIGILDLLLELPPGLRAKWVAPRAMSAGIVTHLIHNFRLLRRPIADSSEASLVSRRVDELWRIVKFPSRGGIVSQIERQLVGPVCMKKIEPSGLKGSEPWE